MQCREDRNKIKAILFPLVEMTGKKRPLLTTMIPAVEMKGGEGRMAPRKYGCPYNGQKRWQNDNYRKVPWFL